MLFPIFEKDRSENQVIVSSKYISREMVNRADKNKIETGT